MGDTTYAVAEAAWGDHEPEPATWRCGPWSLERRGDELADVAFEGRPVLRMLRAVARDRDWGTVPSAVTDVTSDETTLSVGLHLHGLGADFAGALTVAARGDSLSIVLELTARTDFDRNRLGLIVLLSPRLSGSPLRITHPDGSVDDTTFPVEISPHQPAFDISGLDWAADGLEVDARFGGEEFEMEDQRNWTDASFKTYSTPLSAPFPVRVAAGETVRHTLDVTVRRVGPPPVTADLDEVVLRLADHPVPLIGVGASTAPEPLPGGAPTASFVVVEAVPSTPNWHRALARAASEAAAAAVPLDVRIVSDDPNEIAEVVADLFALRAAGVAVARLGVFSPRTQITQPAAWAALAAASIGLDVALVGGTRAHFTELNRTYETLPTDLPALTFSSTPQMHAVDRAQLVEAVPMQRRTAEQAVRIAGSRPVHIGPITLRPRFNAVATTGPAPEPADLATGYGPERVPSATDRRQSAEALAAWTIASAAAFAVPGVNTLTFFETSGPRGIRDEAGRPFPVARAIEALHGIAGRPQLTADAVPEGVGILGASDADGIVLLAANLRAAPTGFDLRLGAERRRIDLAPYGFARLDLPPT